MKKGILIPIAIILLALAVVVIFFVTSRGVSRPSDTDLESIAEEEQSDSDPSSGSLERYFVQNAEERDAVCNDGSPAVFYYRAGSGDGEDKWIIHLKGGGSCYSLEDCALRWRTQRSLMSSDSYKANSPSGGIMSANSEVNSDFYNWNHVRMQYCSSDTWAGDNEIALESGDTLYFHGKAIVDAVLEDLQTEVPGPSLSDATQVLFTGSSAGAGGVMKNLDHVAEKLPWADVKGVNDSSWNVTAMVGLYSEESEAGTHPGQQSAYEFRGDQVDESCIAENQDAPWQCANSGYSAPYIETPLFLYMDQLDGNQVRKTGVTKPYDDEEKAYLDEFAQAVRDTIEPLDAVFSTRVGKHTALTTSNVFTLEVDGYSYYDVLTNWYFDREGPVKVIEE